MMVCSRDDRMACARIWEKFSGQVTTAEQWNDEAIQELVILVAEIRKCSSNMNYVPRPTIVPTKPWFFRNALRPLKDWLQRGTATYELCKAVGYNTRKRAIEIALARGR
jgi:hypothetical protein